MSLFKVVLSSILFLSSACLAKETIRLTGGEWPPYISSNLAHYGYAAHLVQEAFASVDIEVEYGFFPWKRAFRYAKDGKSSTGEPWHGTLVWVYTEERAKSFLYSDVVMTYDQVLFHLRSQPIHWQKLDDLEGKTIGGTLHTHYPLLESAQNAGILRLERARDYTALFKRLLARRIDAVPHAWNVGRYFLNNNLTEYQRNQITYSPTVMQTHSGYLILSKQIENNYRYRTWFNQGLQNIKANGTYQKLQQNLKDGMYDKPLKSNP